MGYFIRFIHNRDMAAENIMTASCRLRAVLNSPPTLVKKVLSRMQSRNIHIPDNSILKLVADTQIKTRPGNTEVILVRSRRNSKGVQLTKEFLAKARLVYTKLSDHEGGWVHDGDTHLQMISGMYCIALRLLYRYIPLYIQMYRYISIYVLSRCASFRA
jgi:hypothetical protein